MKDKKTNGNVRDAALAILWAVENKQAYSNLLLNKTMDSHGILPKDRGLLTEITYGTLQHQMTLDYYLEPFLRGKIEPWVKVLLRLSLYQIQYLDRIPNHAAVNEAVEIAKKRGHGGIASTVNGILRSVLRKGVRDTADIKDPILRLSVETSHPEWLIRRWSDQFGYDKTAEMAEENNKIPLQTVRVNTVRATPEEVVRLLAEEGMEAAPHRFIPECLTVTGGQPARSKAFAEGLITIQDESSMLPAYALQAEPGQRVLDMCAAPGGKTTHIAEKMANEGELFAMDLHEHKVKLIRQAADRLGHTIITARSGDGRKSGEYFEEASFDRILVDAPCSGLGVIKRKPDIKYTKQEADFERLQSIQLELLNEAASLLKPGGLLVYSTCTVDKEENEGTVRLFQEANPHMEAVPVRLPDGAPNGDGGSVQVFPQDFGGDGFFISAFQKRDKQ